MAKWTAVFFGSSLQLESCYLLDGNPKKIGDIVDALNAGEEAKAEVERFKEDEKLLVDLWRSPAFHHEGQEGDACNLTPTQTAVRVLKQQWERYERLKAELTRAYANEQQLKALHDQTKSIEYLRDKLTEANVEAERLKSEIACEVDRSTNAKRIIDELRAELAKATEEADTRVAATIATAEEWYGRRIPELDQYRPKPRFVWTECKDSFGNTYWACNDNRTVTCHLRNNRVMWWAACPDPLVFDTADDAKDAVERHLTEGER